MADQVAIRSLAISNNEDTLVFTTSSSQIYKINLQQGTDLNQKEEVAIYTPEVLQAAFHVGAINGNPCWNLRAFIGKRRRIMFKGMCMGLYLRRDGGIL